MAENQNMEAPDAGLPPPSKRAKKDLPQAAPPAGLPSIPAPSLQFPAFGGFSGLENAAASVRAKTPLQFGGCVALLVIQILLGALFCYTRPLQQPPQPQP